MKKIAYLLILPLLFLLSCVNHEPEPSPEPGPSPIENPKFKHTKRTLLIYAVASNNLYPDWLNDQNEILLGAQRVARMNKDVRIVVYSVLPKAEEATLSVIEKQKDKWELRDVKKYDRETFSTDPRRMSEVFSDVRTTFPSDNYGLVLWSHATGWTPAFPDHVVAAPKTIMKSYGQDQISVEGPEGKPVTISDQCEITELASAIPDGMFDFVWFDCCYMGAAEVAYEISPKIPMMVAYPSEVWSEGLPYDLVLPFIASEKPDLIGGARKVAEYFSNKGSSYTIGVYDLTAEAFREMPKHFAELINANPEILTLSPVQKYSRSSFGPFYDFRDLYRKMAEPINGSIVDIMEALESDLTSTVKYGSCSDRDFNGYSWDQNVYCGLSVRIPGSSNENYENFYAKTRWGAEVNKYLKK